MAGIVLYHFWRSKKVNKGRKPVIHFKLTGLAVRPSTRLELQYSSSKRKQDTPVCQPAFQPSSLSNDQLVFLAVSFLTVFNIDRKVNLTMRRRWYHYRLWWLDAMQCYHLYTHVWQLQLTNAINCRAANAATMIRDITWKRLVAWTNFFNTQNL